uniref:SJCHGC02510 protein n=1 Tax=Schistosoma japonicum TaxID=6182 RepID=Q5DDN5_SCHJA|nr:SJCHGC02510 protein [Schistosoma japonicum]
MWNWRKYVSDRKIWSKLSIGFSFGKMLLNTCLIAPRICHMTLLSNGSSKNQLQVWGYRNSASISWLIQGFEPVFFNVFLICINSYIRSSISMFLRFLLAKQLKHISMMLTPLFIV